MQLAGLRKYLLIISFLGAYSCKPTANTETFQVYYYPDRNVYYVPAANLYYYSVDGGASWDSLPGGFDTDTSLLGNRTIIETGDHDFYGENEAHRKKYSGVLYNLYTPLMREFNVGPVTGGLSLQSESETSRVQK